VLSEYFGHVLSLPLAFHGGIHSGRLLKVMSATTILVFGAGHIVESGTFDELLAKDGVFAELARAQSLAPQASADPVKEAD
jgi:ATP-binding cassette, subfamily B, beta-glucan exporter